MGRRPGLIPNLLGRWSTGRAPYLSVEDVVVGDGLYAEALFIKRLNMRIVYLTAVIWNEVLDGITTPIRQLFLRGGIFCFLSWMICSPGIIRLARLLRRYINVHNVTVSFSCSLLLISCVARAGREWNPRLHPSQRFRGKSAGRDACSPSNQR